MKIIHKYLCMHTENNLLFFFDPEFRISIQNENMHMQNADILSNFH